MNKNGYNIVNKVLQEDRFDKERVSDIGGGSVLTAAGMVARKTGSPKLGMAAIILGLISASIGLFQKKKTYILDDINKSKMFLLDYKKQLRTDPNNERLQYNVEYYTLRLKYDYSAYNTIIKYTIQIKKSKTIEQVKSLKHQIKSELKKQNEQYRDALSLLKHKYNRIIASLHDYN